MPALRSPRTDAPLGVDAIVVAGGRARRLGGRDKGALLSDGATLRDRTLNAVASARSVAWVGEPWSRAADSGRIRFTLEQPRYGGPAAAVQAGLAALPHPLVPWVIVIAVDVPRIEDSVALLLAALQAHARAADTRDGVIGLDESGHRQPLLAIYRTTALTAAVDRQSSGLDGVAVRALLSGLDLHDVALADGVTRDIDTPEDAAYHGIELPPNAEESPS